MTLKSLQVIGVAIMQWATHFLLVVCNNKDSILHNDNVVVVVFINHYHFTMTNIRNVNEK